MKKFVLRVPVNASKEKIFASVGTPAGLETWFLREANFTGGKTIRLKWESIRPDDTYEWKWHGYPDYSGVGKILENNEKDLFSFTFTGKCVVTIELISEQGETMIVLTQTNIPEESNPEKDLYIQCQKGWTFYLTNLKSVLENGYDLRNKKNEIQNVITA